MGQSPARLRAAGSGGFLAQELREMLITYECNTVENAGAGATRSMSSDSLRMCRDAE